MSNTPKTVNEALSLAGKTWSIGEDVREITRIENAQVSQYDRRTVMADVYWRKPGGKERIKPTPLTTFTTWLNKANPSC
ncbi:MULTISPECIES: hypothetical protein [Vibrio harveyi group]|jgi:hypothetical protein|uniref:hypothetical protein n=1 Tax=Vibrio harveyi group TaxID=717610 RepID=UPI00046FC8D5|nr:MULTISPECIES: hypothetical protein [Vibrio harveyi group]MBO0179911.1 hypothetical protein [Vibrio parahaemolyticus]MDF5360107.1 hypothetical protein [Vibrio parahaemolyticus]MDG2755113.1 hypothetical protein [Vibrio parahaemolyticus]MDG2763920.1 hypothetical protein [Vibrio parahaemolyticus]QKS98337.1 hypothetical protein HUO05_24355 [Vibrio alginolyticus]